MKDKQLKRLSRAELLELLLEQTKKAEQLQEKLEKAQALLSDRYLQIQEAGDLAQAVLKINGVMETAQAAAQQYLDNIINMEQQTKAQCEALLAQAREDARRIRAGEEPQAAPVPEAEVTDSNQPDDLPEESDG